MAFRAPSYYWPIGYGRYRMSYISIHSLRAQKARLAHRIGKTGYRTMQILYWISLLAAVFLFLFEFNRFAYLIGAITVTIWMFATWYKRDLSVLTPKGQSPDERLSVDALALLPTNQPLTPRNVWNSYKDNWQLRFYINRLLLSADSISQLLSDQETDLPNILEKAQSLPKSPHSSIEAGHIVAAMLLDSKEIMDLCSKLNISSEDILSVQRWLNRVLDRINREEPYFGGIGRDWATGFTPKLNVFGVNISQAIQHHKAHFGALTSSAGVHALRSALSKGNGTVALIGNEGSGKTSHVYALAQSLLAETHEPRLRHKQIIGLDASAIISHAQRQGELEHIVTNLIHEASHAGNIVLFLDNAHLFLRDGNGTFDATHLLLPAAQSNSFQLVLAMTPKDLQQLKANNSPFASSLTPVVLQEPDPAHVLEILQDTTMKLEHRQKTLITHKALIEARKLSDRYMQDLANPGRSIRLLEQAISYPDNGIITDTSIQRSVEETQGVKLTSVNQAESDTLIHLEDRIHERMVNQNRAVQVVSSALRRSRAGVANPNRPMGSFLFLGPTGVGKTELAKAVCSVYFGDEKQMIRLDMSEYQHADDVHRLLSDGTADSNSLIMSVRTQPYSVILLDEIEKAHTNILNLLLQLLDEGQLNDSSGKPASFRDCIIITTSNAGAQSIRQQVEQGKSLEEFEKPFINELIDSGQFKPELLNRYDEIVLFRPLNENELEQVVGLMIDDVNKTLAHQNISVELKPEAAKKVVQLGYDPRLGARPMRRMIQRTIEDTIAKLILQNRVSSDDHIILDENDIKTDN